MHVNDKLALQRNSLWATQITPKNPAPQPTDERRIVATAPCSTMRHSPFGLNSYSNQYGCLVKKKKNKQAISIPWGPRVSDNNRSVMFVYPVNLTKPSLQQQCFKFCFCGLLRGWNPLLRSTSVEEKEEEEEVGKDRKKKHRSYTCSNKMAT